MLTIRQAQIDALSVARLNRFQARLEALLAATAPQLSPEAIALASATVIDQAPRFGLASESAIARFGVISLNAFGDYPKAPLPIPALAILMSHGLDPERKLERYQTWASGRPVE
ncbi:hypothetical protein PS3A_36400 [Pseudomonas sp. 3A(2025)]